MNRDEVQKLLGGYATGTLTQEEQQALFEAALEDQSLFDQLAKEQPLQELLSDSAVRAQLLAALDTKPAPWYKRWATWGLPALATAMLVGGLVVWRVNQTRSGPVEVAQVSAPAPQPTGLPMAPPQRTPLAPVPSAKPLLAPNRRAENGPAERREEPKMKAQAQLGVNSAPVELKDAKKEAEAVPATGPPAPAAAPAPPAPPPAQASSGLPNAASPQNELRLDKTATNGLSGTVRDPSGAIVPGAQVKVLASNGNAPVATVQAGANGDFNVPVNSGAYQVEVSAPGFQTFRRDGVLVNATAQNRLPVTLQVGTAAETVEVSAAAGVVQSQQQSAQPLVQQSRQTVPADRGASMAKAASTFEAARAVRTTTARILRKNADGSAAQAPAEDLQKGESIVIEIVPATSGYLTVAEKGASQLLVNGAKVDAGKAFDTPPIALAAAGQREFTASLSNTPPAPGGGGGGGRGGRAGAAGSLGGMLAPSQKRADAAADAIAPQPVTIRITVR